MRSYDRPSALIRRGQVAEVHFDSITLFKTKGGFYISTSPLKARSGKSMNKQERIKAIERIIESFRGNLINGQYFNLLATAIEEAIGVDERILFRVLLNEGSIDVQNDSKYKSNKHTQDFIKAILTNKEVITIKENHVTHTNT